MQTRHVLALLALFGLFTSPATAATFTVTTTANSGAGSLRQAMTDANATVAADTIAFNISGAGVKTISPTSALPAIVQPVTINGASQPGFVDAPLIQLNGTNAGANVSGLTISAANCTIRALAINRFSLVGLVLNSNGNKVEGCTIGTDPTGANDLGNASHGVIVGGTLNTIGGTSAAARNVISGNARSGVLLSLGAANNVVQGNTIGATKSGTAALANGEDGVLINDAPNNTIGGTVAGAGNVISGNGGSGVSIATGAAGNVVQGNTIGLKATGTAKLGNGAHGVLINDSPDNTIGGTVAGAGNVISGNGGAGIDIIHSGASGTVVQGNRIGTNAAGTAALGNVRGVAVVDAANDILIGGTVAAGAPGAGRNVIAGNTGSGVFLSSGSGATGIVVAGNYIGTDVNGSAALGNTGEGVEASGANFTIGGTVPEARNVISGNGGSGVLFTTNFTSGSKVQGNYIGTDKNGSAALPNANGVKLQSGAHDNTIGGTAAGARNVIAGNQDNGVWLTGPNTDGNLVQGNTIGLKATGTAKLGNGAAGVLLSILAANNIIGGTASGAGNVLSGNAGSGVSFASGATGNRVQGNLIGTDLNGTADLGNGAHGVFIDATPGNTIGGTGSAARNVISGNAGNGVFISGQDADGNVVQGNFIGTDLNGATALGNSGYGVRLSDAPNTSVGGTTNGARNVIAGNGSFGVGISGSHATGNLVAGNYIGTDATGTAKVGNLHGVSISGVGHNTIGGTSNAARNVIAGNANTGVSISALGASDNLVAGNTIGLNAAGTAALGNGSWGLLVSGAPNNTIGGTAPPTRNVIAGNGSHGILISGSSATGNKVQSNYIGTNAAGTAKVGNAIDGVAITLGATGNTIGGLPAAGTTVRNVISGNLNNGVSIDGAATSGNVVQGNTIGLNAAGTAALGNTHAGVQIHGAPGNFIGGGLSGTGNVISGNGSFGLVISVDTASGNRVAGNHIGTDLNGALAVGNAGIGIYISGAPNNTIGGFAGGNVISGNADHGIFIASSGASGNLVTGNHIGTDKNGSAALGNSGDGVQCNGAPNNTIGGTGAGTRNVISGNGGSGVTLAKSGAGGNLVQGNTIGAAVDGVSPLGNGAHGVLVTDFAAHNTIGGTSGGGNVIAFNGADGVSVANGAGNRVASNAIFSNTGLGIDLGPNGVTPNDKTDPDNGGNNLQNFPVLASAITTGSDTSIQGTLNSKPSAIFRLEFFSNPTADPSGSGEGKTFLGASLASTNTLGNATFNFTPSSTVPGGYFVTATATNNATSDTSEFSAARQVQGDGALSISDVTVTEGDSGTISATFTITLSIASSQTVTVNVTTADGTATAPADYTAIAPISRTFMPGQTSKTVTVQVQGDTLNEADETFKVNLSGAVNATIADSQGVGTITDDDASA